MSLKDVAAIITALAALIGAIQAYDSMNNKPATQGYDYISNPPNSLSSINKAPVAFIDSIKPNPVAEGKNVTFTGHGEDPDGDSIIGYRWESNVFGFLSDKKTFATSKLKEGFHQITFQVKAGKEWSDPKTINLQIDPPSPSATINKIWVDYDAFEKGIKGLRIHVSFDVSNLKGENGKASAYFYTTDGEALEDSNQIYLTNDGKVAVSKDFKPSFEESQFNDLSIFMPNDEFDIRTPGKYYLKFNVIIWYGSTILDKSEWVRFTYTRS